MTDIDLDAIRDAIGTVRLWATPDTKGDLDRFAHDLADCADALLARLAEVEAERDELKNDRHIAAGNSEHWQQRTRNLEAEVANLAAENARLRQERDHWQQVGRQETERRCKAEDETDAMRPVVEAAQAWRDGKFGHVTPVAAPYYCGAPEEPPLVAAVDAYRAGQKAREAAPESTQPREDGETVGDVLDALETLNEIAYGPAPINADPPGLDAAIEAAVDDVAARYSGGRRDGTMSEAFTASDGYTSVRFATVAEVIPFAIRAAAPALRAGALREAADAIRARYAEIRLAEDEQGVAPGNSMIHVMELAALTVDRLMADHIDADRIGGAT